jgi:hypothetical protein
MGRRPLPKLLVDWRERTLFDGNPRGTDKRAL